VVVTHGSNTQEKWQIETMAKGLGIIQIEVY
jgi:hypothetical protein